VSGFCPRGAYVLGASVQGVFVREGFGPGGLISGGLCPTPVQNDHPLADPVSNGQAFGESTHPFRSACMF